jgi:hypothetical protein
MKLQTNSAQQSYAVYLRHQNQTTITDCLIATQEENYLLEYNAVESGM